MGSIRDITNSSGILKDHIEYDAFGNIVSETDASWSGRYMWTGREWDPDIKLQYNRARWYDPTIGRWTTEDPIGFEGGDANLYRYVENNPLNGVDPDGLRQIVLPPVQPLRRIAAPKIVRVTLGEFYDDMLRVHMTEAAANAVLAQKAVTDDAGFSFYFDMATYNNNRNAFSIEMCLQRGNKLLGSAVWANRFVIPEYNGLVVQMVNTTLRYYSLRGRPVQPSRKIGLVEAFQLRNGSSIAVDTHMTNINLDITRHSKVVVNTILQVGAGQTFLGSDTLPVLPSTINGAYQLYFNSNTSHISQSGFEAYLLSRKTTTYSYTITLEYKPHLNPPCKITLDVDIR